MGDINGIDQSFLDFSEKKHIHPKLDNVYFTPKFSFLFSETFTFFYRIV